VQFYHSEEKSMDVEYILKNLDTVRVCLSDIYGTKGVNQLVVENAANHLFDAVCEITNVEK
jgi:hypothetical protein